MLKKVLIANRGEIAVRIIRECYDNGIQPVAVYSTADRDSLHRKLAARSVCIGGPRAEDSYLTTGNIIEAALRTGCDGIHPGFGFLSENSGFARECREAGLVFIGPSPETIDQMGNKARARELMEKAGVPTVPGSDGTVKTAEEAAAVGDRIGYPVLLKASAGGGGRGMRRADSHEEALEAFTAASREAETCFGNGEMYVEKLILSPKHIEFQILADRYGNTIHLGERNCSIQRRNQKMLEEAPAWGISREMRDEMGRAAVRAAVAAGYENAGTVEFVTDREGNFYFIEMNTRIQVEHPVTEMVTGVNLIREQLRIAAGQKLSLSQEDVEIRGHAIECRITAEKPEAGFTPDPGKVRFLHFPDGNGVRVDSALYSGCEISPFYDPMIAKIIVRGDTRLEAVRKMRRALAETIIGGVSSTLPVQYLMMYNGAFLRGDYDTGFLEENLDQLVKMCSAVDAAGAAGAAEEVK